MSKAPLQEPVLEIKDLHVGFRSIMGRTRAVNGLSLDIRPGEIVGLVGESGCGKSITARSIVGLVPSPPAQFEKGEIWLQTREGRVDTLALRKNERAMRKIRGRDVAMIFQEPMRSLHPMIPIGSQIVEGILEHEHITTREAEERTEQMLDLVGLPQPAKLMGKYCHELSGGMRQRALIALALVCHPQLLIADEPTTALDVTIQAQILNLLRDIRERLGMSVLLITHNMGVVANLSDRISVMYLGVIVETGTVDEVFKQPAHPYTRGLLASIPSLSGNLKSRLPSLEGVVPELALAPTGCVFSDRCPYAMARCAETPAMISLTEGHQAACWLFAPGHAARSERAVISAADGAGSAMAAAATPNATQNLLEVQGLSLHYPIYRGLIRTPIGAVRAVDGIDLAIKTGETLGLVGESGCGKTSVGRLVTRLFNPTAGRILFRGDGDLEDITRVPEQQMKRVRRHMGLIFQDPLSSLNPRMNVRDIVGEPIMLHGLARGRGVDDRVSELLEMVGLRSEHRSRFPHAFSGGQRQRIAIARALATQPRFLIADEPVSALDVSVQSQVLNLLLELQERLGLSILFIAHDIAVVRHVSDLIAVMYLGKIIEMGGTEEICSHPVHPYTEALLSSIPLPMPGLKAVRAVARGDLPDPSTAPRGCRFHTRCVYRQEICEREEPALTPVQRTAEHYGACHFQNELQLAGVEALTAGLQRAGQPTAGPLSH
jgi:peptide/nickel transport system ATP-binding protein